MKLRYLFLVGLVFFLVGCATIAGPKLQVQESYDFGNIDAKNGVVSTTLKLKNIGSENLEILGVSTSCGCTTAKVGKDNLQPGEETLIDIEFDPNAHEGLTGLLKRIVYIRTNDANEKETQIRITVTVEDSHEQDNEANHDINLEENQISPFELHEKTEQDNNRVILDLRSAEEYSQGHIPEAINFQITSLQELEYDLSSEIIVYGKSSITGETGYNTLIKQGYVNVKYLFGGFTHWEEDSYVIEKADSIKKVQPEFFAGPKISFDRELYDFGQVPQLGGVVSTNFTVTNSGDSDLKITSISTSCGCTSAKINNDLIKPGQSTILSVFFDPNFHKEPEGIFKRTVFLETNDLNNQEAEARIQIEVLEGQ
ncbi:MAG: DUF1573 domain-containing protein [Nanoarchaeota archaeon]